MVAVTRGTLWRGHVADHVALERPGRGDLALLGVLLAIGVVLARLVVGGRLRGLGRPLLLVLLELLLLLLRVRRVLRRHVPLGLSSMLLAGLAVA